MPPYKLSKSRWPAFVLCAAHELRDKTWIGKADPYCVVKVADAEIQTQYVKNAGDHVVWEER